MGNRGVLHDANGVLGAALYRHRAWVCCVLSFRDRRRALMQPGRYTELFFLDEAVALAAGHRPCGECRRPDHMRFRAAWADAGLGTDLKVDEIDRRLHAARIERGRPRRHRAAAGSLPDGTFIEVAGAPALVLGPALLPWAPAGYGPPLPRPSGGDVTVLTPAPTVAVLRAGYRPTLHPSALGAVTG